MKPGTFKPRSSRLARGSEMKRGGRIKPKKRTASEFARVYGSRARVAWVKAQPCVVGSLGCDGPSQNAHTANGGMGRKADADTIVPMCDGHHRLLHCWGVETFSRSYALDLPALAARTERLWREHLNRTAA